MNNTIEVKIEIIFYILFSEQPSFQEAFDIISKLQNIQKITLKEFLVNYRSIINASKQFKLHQIDNKVKDLFISQVKSLTLIKKRILIVIFENHKTNLEFHTIRIKLSEYQNYRPSTMFVNKYFDEISQIVNLLSPCKDNALPIKTKDFISTEKSSTKNSNKTLAKKEYPAKKVFKQKYTNLDTINIYEENVYTSLDKLIRYLEENHIDYSDGNKIKTEEYHLAYFKNLVYLNFIANKEIEEYAPDLKNTLIALGRNIPKYGFSRIYDINNAFSNFQLLSRDYPDFINSEYIKENDYFEIILEYKKGSATKNYLDSFISELKMQMISDNGFSNEEFEKYLDDALLNWELDLDDVHIRSDEFTFFQDDLISSVLDSENKFIPLSQWFTNKLTFEKDNDFALFDYCNGDLSLLCRAFSKVHYTQINELKKLLENTNDIDFKMFWANDVFRFNIDKNHSDIDKSISKILLHLDTFYNISNDITMKEYNNYKNYASLLEKSDKWIFEYNKMILESKKDAIRKKFKLE